VSGDDGAPKLLSGVALRSLFRDRDFVRLVFLNACHSRAQLEAVTESVDAAIGVQQALSDRAAITFAAAFYRSLGFVHSVKQAFEDGKTAMLLENDGAEPPELVVKKGVDAAALYLVT
jgi:hypothetical protein